MDAFVLALKGNTRPDTFDNIIDFMATCCASRIDEIHISKDTQRLTTDSFNF